MVKFPVLFWIITLSVIVVDQISKYIIEIVQPNITLGVLQIHSSYNTGAGFGILQGQTLILAFVSLLVALGVILYYPQIPKEKIPQVLFSLFLGGVLGNAIDRLFRRAVVDFIDFSFWPSFNVADAAISVAVIGLIWWSWKN